MGWRTVLKFVLPALVVAALSGCGHGPDRVCMSPAGSPVSGGGAPAACPMAPASPPVVPVSPTGAPGLISLKIRRVDQPGATPVDLYLHCRNGVPESDSTVPNPAAACTLVNSTPGLLNPVPAKGEMCSQLYGGPETATLTGSVNGKAVHLELSRTDGCKTAQWNGLLPLLGGPAAGV